MSLSSLPLSYCTNVHPGLTVSAVLEGLRTYTVPLQREFAAPVAAGLWLAEPVIREILNAESGAERFSDQLADLGLVCHTLNAFPYGDFHSERVKDQVYLPDWSTPERLRYTCNCATILANCLSEKGEGSISTLPLGFKGHRQSEQFQSQVIRNLIEIAEFLERLHRETGKLIRLGIEPEPFCLLETTPETIDFFHALRQAAPDSTVEQRLRQYIGLCYDVCHQAVEFEDIAESIRSIHQADIRINKLHITCALQLDNPSENREGRQALAAYAEPRYLHQTIGRSADGKLLRFVDLTPEFALHPESDWHNADPWRIHFHVPVNAETVGPLRTTREQLVQAVQAVADLDYAPHLEVETYTWGVLPSGDQSSPPQQRTPAEKLVRGLAEELHATRQLVERIRTRDA